MGERERRKEEYGSLSSLPPLVLPLSSSSLLTGYTSLLDGKCGWIERASSQVDRSSSVLQEEEEEKSTQNATR